MKQGSFVLFIIGKAQRQVFRHVVPGGWSDLLGWPRNRGLEVLSGFIHRRSGMSYDVRTFLFFLYFDLSLLVVMRHDYDLCVRDATASPGAA